jgi:hypothetical protein
MKTRLLLPLLLVLMLTACTQTVKVGGGLQPAGSNEGGLTPITGGAAKSNKASEPADLLKRFQEANNSRNIQALMDCYDPEFIEFSQAVGEGVGGALSDMLFGFSVDADTSKMMPFLSKAFQKYVQSDDVYATIELTELSTTYSDDNNAVINYNEKVIEKNGTIQSDKDLELPATRIDGVWYISMTDALLSGLEALSK